MIVDPADGRIPWLPQAKIDNDLERARYGVGPYDSWEDLDTGERCITDGLPNMVPIQPYNMNFHIFQTRKWVAILHEMYHEVRIVPLDDRPLLPSSALQWLGAIAGSPSVDQDRRPRRIGVEEDPGGNRTPAAAHERSREQQG